MVITVADTLFSRLIDAFPADRSYDSSAFSRDPMPGPLRDYLEQRLALRLENAVRPDDRWIDADDEEVREAASTYRRSLARHLAIPADEWRIELGLACRTVASYLIRPAHTLSDLVFADGIENATLEDISIQLRLVPSYSYFGDVISAYFEQKDLEHIGKERFAGLVRRIDHQMVRDFGTKEWMKLLQPLREVARHIPEFSGGLPVDVLRTFFQEKGADALIARLEARFKAKGVRLISSTDLRDFLDGPPENDIVEIAEEASPEGGHVGMRDVQRRDSHVPLWKQFESGLRSAPGSAATPAESGGAPSARTADEQPLWKQFRGSVRPSPAQDGPELSDPTSRDQTPPRAQSATREEPASRAEAAPPMEAPDRSDAAYRREYSPPAEAPPLYRPSGSDARPAGLSELEHAVLGQRGSRNRDLFLKHLFSGSSEAYEDTLRKLNLAESWSEASQIIAREVFIKHQVNIYSEPAVAFTDAAEAKFRS